MKQHLLLIFFLCIFFSYSQKEKNPAIKQNGKEISDFIPDGWEELTSQKEDLNLDSLKDVILVLKAKGEDSLSTAEHPVKRIFLILNAQKDKSYKLAVRNENVVYYYNYDGNFKDALSDLRTAKGMFYIDHYGGFARRWGRTSVFKYNVKEKNWFLIKEEYSTFMASDIDNTESERVLTAKELGKISIKQFDIYKELKVSKFFGPR